MNADRGRFTQIKKKKKSVKFIGVNLRCEASAISAFLFSSVPARCRAWYLHLGESTTIFPFYYGQYGPLKP